MGHQLNNILIYSFLLLIIVHVVPEKISVYLTENVTWESLTTTVNHPTVIVSHGYPFHYLSEELWLWKVFFNSSTYVNAVVFNISFNQNQVSELYLCCLSISSEDYLMKCIVLARRNRQC